MNTIWDELLQDIEMADEFSDTNDTTTEGRYDDISIAGTKVLYK